MNNRKPVVIGLTCSIMAALLFTVVVFVANAGVSRESRQLIRAIENGDTRDVKLLLPLWTGREINDFRMPDGSPLLHFAAWHGESEIVRLLLEHGVDPDMRNDEGTTALMDTVFSGGPPSQTLSVASILIESGAQIEATDDWGNTAMHWATRAGRAREIDALIGMGADVNARNVLGETPLHMCVRGIRQYGADRKPVTLLKLLGAGADPRLKNSKGVSSLDLAVLWKDDDLVACLQTVAETLNSEEGSPAKQGNLASP